MPNRCSDAADAFGIDKAWSPDTCSVSRD